MKTKTKNTLLFLGVLGGLLLGSRMDYIYQQEEQNAYYLRENNDNECITMQPDTVPASKN